MKAFFLILSTALLLSACGEKPQGSGSGRADKPSWDGTGVAVFTEPGWKAGDRNSWQLALRARTQYGQNEYSRAN